MGPEGNLTTVCNSCCLLLAIREMFKEVLGARGSWKTFFPWPWGRADVASWLCSRC